jgi:hypothetical protein
VATPVYFVRATENNSVFPGYRRVMSSPVPPKDRPVVSMRPPEKPVHPRRQAFLLILGVFLLIVFLAFVSRG